MAAGLDVNERLDDIIDKLLHVDDSSHEETTSDHSLDDENSDRASEDSSEKDSDEFVLSDQEIQFLCQRALAVFQAESTLLRLSSPVIVCGDIHGQYNDLVRIYSKEGIPPAKRYLMLGDFVDRGEQSLEVICLHFAFKARHPDSLYLVRGNHECREINEFFGFFDECIWKLEDGQKMWEEFCTVFEWMPLVALISDRILCMHGGLSPDIDFVDEIDQIARPVTSLQEGGPATDITWADPGYELESGFSANVSRGLSYMYSSATVKTFQENNDIDLIIRAHEVVTGGYKYFADESLITLFTAPNYCQKSNTGAYMIIDSELQYSFQKLRPREEDQE